MELKKAIVCTDLGLINEKTDRKNKYQSAENVLHIDNFMRNLHSLEVGSTATTVGRSIM